MIDNFVQVDISVEGMKHRLESSGIAGISKFFESNITNVSSPDSHQVNPYDGNAFSVRIGDVIAFESVEGSYLVTDVHVEYYSQGFNSDSTDPFIRVRIVTKRN